MQDWPYQIWIALAFVGMGTVWAGIYAARSARRTWDWPTALATITRVEKPKMTKHAGGEGEPTYSVDLGFTIRYPVRGRDQDSKQTESWSGRDYKPAEEFIARNPVGKRFEILFNPDDPLEVLRNGPKNPEGGRFLAAFGVGAALIGLVNLAAGATTASSVIMAVVSIVVAAGVAGITKYPFENYSPLEAHNQTRMIRTG